MNGPEDVEVGDEPRLGPCDHDAAIDAFRTSSRHVPRATDMPISMFSSPAPITRFVRNRRGSRSRRLDVDTSDTRAHSASCHAPAGPCHDTQSVALESFGFSNTPMRSAARVKSYVVAEPRPDGLAAVGLGPVGERDNWVTVIGKDVPRPSTAEAHDERSTRCRSRGRGSPTHGRLRRPTDNVDTLELLTAERLHGKPPDLNDTHRGHHRDDRAAAPAAVDAMARRRFDTGRDDTEQEPVVSVPPRVHDGRDRRSLGCEWPVFDASSDDEQLASGELDPAASRRDCATRAPPEPSRSWISESLTCPMTRGLHSVSNIARCRLIATASTSFVSSIS